MFLQLEFINKESNYKMLVMSICVNYAATEFIAEKLLQPSTAHYYFFFLIYIWHLTHVFFCTSCSRWGQNVRLIVQYNWFNLMILKKIKNTTLIIVFWSSDHVITEISYNFKQLFSSSVKAVTKILHVCCSRKHMCNVGNIQ